MIGSFTSCALRCLSLNVTSKSFLKSGSRAFSQLTVKFHEPGAIFTIPKRFKGFSVQDNITIQVKRRPIRKRHLEETAAGYFNVTAFATAEEFDLDKLARLLEQQNLYIAYRFFPNSDYEEEPKDVLHVRAKYQIDQEERDIYFFKEGTVVLWNCNDLECGNVLSFLKPVEIDRYEESMVHEEVEQMLFSYVKTDAGPHLKNNRFYLSKKEDKNASAISLEKYTYSNAISLSVKLGTWEASLDNYIDSIEPVIEDLKRGKPLTISRGEMLRKTGELFALRHMINLSSDLLDTPDFYWDREQLENLYSQTCSYFSIPKRTRVMNEKINHCVELADLIRSHLSDNHHVRLEWMIIILIMVEVGFEIVHFIERFLL